jgi:hypothetical protein
MESTTFIMFKIAGGIKIHEFTLNAISDHHAISVAHDFTAKQQQVRRLVYLDFNRQPSGRIVRGRMD